MKTSDFDYDLPAEFIAQTPAEPRDASRLLVLNRATGELTHKVFREIIDYLYPGDLLILNQTRVIPARVYGNKDTGGKIEILLLRRESATEWEAMVGGKGLHPGRRITLGADARVTGEIVTDFGDMRRLIKFDSPLEDHLDQIGEVPLPPYIHESVADPERYQTVFSAARGSAAAPTAGLHFTPELLDRIREKGVGVAKVTLHVGLDTFLPVHEDDPAEHQIHSEWCQLPPETAAAIRQTQQKGGRVVCVGTTSVRTVESAAGQAGGMAAFEGPTRLFILPGYQFKAVDALVTNFHLPKSTLLMMMSAFTGREQILAAYETAKQEGYRFFSFGDAMLIV